MPGLYNETVQMLLEARHYFGAVWPHYEKRLTTLERLHFSSEMSRITMRLTCVMSWLSVQRAIAAGEMTREDAKREYPLDGDSLCLGCNIEGESLLPREMCRLLDRSLSLYERIHRLDHQIGLAE